VIVSSVIKFLEKSSKISASVNENLVNRCGSLLNNSDNEVWRKILLCAVKACHSLVLVNFCIFKFFFDTCCNAARIFMLLRLLFLLLPMLAITVAHATPDLLTVYQQALIADPIIAGAHTTALSAQENIAITRANLLPNVQFFASATANRAGQGNPAMNGTTDIYNINLQQTLFNYASWLNLQKNELTAKASLTDYAAKLQQLITRVANAYFDQAEADTRWQLSKANNQALSAKLRDTVLRFKVGLVKQADVANAKAAYDNSTIDVISARNNLLHTQLQLQEMTAVIYPKVALLKNSFPLISPQPAQLSNWLDQATAQNFSLLAARLIQQAAHKNIAMQRAGAYPILNANLSYNGNRSQNNGIATTSTSSGVAEVNFNLPIYQGGLIVAETKQAQYDYQTAHAYYLQVLRNVCNHTQQNYYDVLANLAKITSGKLALESNLESLNNTMIAYKAGIRTISDVLLAQQSLYQAQLSYVQSEYAYFRSLLALKESAGILTIDDLKKVDYWLR
jgi:outer membrane protein